MGWGKVAEYLLSFVKWCWQNKFTMIFIATTIVFLSMYGCEKSTNKKLNGELTVEKGKIAQCNANYNTAISANKETVKGLDICQKELKITKESFENAKSVMSQFDEEIKKYKELAKQIDAEKDPEKQLEMKKKIIEELFKGKKMIQIKLKR